MGLVTLFVTTLPKTPRGLLRALWLSFASLFDPGQSPEAIGPGAHIAVLGYLFFIVVRAPGATLTQLLSFGVGARCGSPMQAAVVTPRTSRIAKDAVADYG
jgi:hypothetical protein